MAVSHGTSKFHFISARKQNYVLSFTVHLQCPWHILFIDLFNTNLIQIRLVIKLGRYHLWESQRSHRQRVKSDVSGLVLAIPLASVMVMGGNNLLLSCGQYYRLPSLFLYLEKSQITFFFPFLKAKCPREQTIVPVRNPKKSPILLCIIKIPIIQRLQPEIFVHSEKLVYHFVFLRKDFIEHRPNGFLLYCVKGKAL